MPFAVLLAVIHCFITISHVTSAVHTLNKHVGEICAHTTHPTSVARHFPGKAAAGLSQEAQDNGHMVLQLGASAGEDGGVRFARCSLGNATSIHSAKPYESVACSIDLVVLMIFHLQMGGCC